MNEYRTPGVNASRGGWRCQSERAGPWYELLPGLTDGLRRLEFGEGSQLSVPIAILIWLMIIPIMMKVDFAAIRNVGRRPCGLLVTLFVNWLVKPFSMALIAWRSDDAAWCGSRTRCCLALPR